MQPGRVTPPAKKQARILEHSLTACIAILNTGHSYQDVELLGEGDEVLALLSIKIAAVDEHRLPGLQSGPGLPHAGFSGLVAARLLDDILRMSSTKS